jgi:hypothetical protein
MQMRDRLERVVRRMKRSPFHSPQQGKSFVIALTIFLLTVAFPFLGVGVRDAVAVKETIVAVFSKPAPWLAWSVFGGTVAWVLTVERRNGGDPGE